MSEETQVRLELVKALLARDAGQQLRSLQPGATPPDRYAGLKDEVDRLAAVVIRPAAVAAPG